MGCGVQPSKIVGGSPVTPYSIPWQVALVDSGGNWPWCGGTLIDESHVLTAAHCTDENFDIIVGDHDWTSSNDGTRHTVCKTVIHPSYSQSAVDNDFAVVHLQSPVEIGARAVPACLPPTDGAMAGDFLAGKNMTVSGWGALSEGGSQPIELHSVSVPGITNFECNQAYSSIQSISDAMLCAGNVEYGGVDSCQGDSGGKLSKSVPW